MNSFKKYIAVYLCITALLTILFIIFFRIVAPAEYPVLLPAIPIYFVLLGIVSYEVSRKFLDSKHNVHHVWVIFRFCKLIVSILLLFIYAMVIHKTIVSFMLTFFVFYFVLMIFEIIFMLNLARRKEESR